MRKVEVVEYQERWPMLFSEEAVRLEQIFTGILEEIYHIGSTSVAGLPAKPVIDIMPVVKKIEHVDQFNEAMEAIGYEAKGEHGIPRRRFFKKGGDDRTHHVHVFEAGSPDIDRHLAFRDYLRTHPEEAEAYGQLKADLAKKFPTDIESYINGKDPFIKERERRALAWYRKQND
ncbi:GrpB family protein [Thalassobacillus devorans]|uniref:GrpB family protein n=1 Tax=Thalassobacillus devorans TaxID=279813 RepID=UPI00048C5FC6|nr:GrpB family protein [Thalassobacillus devorans]